MSDPVRVRPLLLGAAVAAALLMSGCVAEEPAPSTSPSPSASASPTRSASASPTAAPSASPTVAPAPAPSAAPSPQTPSQGTASDGWTYSQLSGICQDFVLNRPERNANEQWNFDAGYPAQRYGGVWDIAFDGTFTLPDQPSPIAAIVGCAISGSPTSFSVGLSEASGDAPADEVLQP